MVNGEKPHSQFLEVGSTPSFGMLPFQYKSRMSSNSCLQHLTSYPVVSDSISLFKSNPYGAKSLQLGDQAYTRIAKPVLPYFSTPYSYVAPYLARADAIGDQGLTEIDSRFPIIREDTQKIRGTIYDTAGLPIRVAGDVKQHLFQTYGSEYKKCGGDGVVASGKALITTSLVLSTESLSYLTTWFQKAKGETKEVINEKANSH